MRIYLSSLILLLTFCSCKKEQTQQVVEIYSPEDFNNKVKIVDTACINETNRAKKDLQKGKAFLNRMILYNRPGYSPKKYFDSEGEKYVIRELAKLGIGIDTTSILRSSLRSSIDDLFQENCYQSIMRDEIYAVLKYHSVSLDSLIRKAERQYVINNPDKIFSLEDRDFSHNSADSFFEDFITKSEVVFKENFIYPKDYKPKKENSYSYTRAHFILMKDGTITNLQVEATFQNYYNIKHKEYFEKEIRNFVLKTIWVHPKYSGVVANSEMNFTIYHK